MVTFFLSVWNSWVSGILGSSVNFSMCSFSGGGVLPSTLLLEAK